MKESLLVYIVSAPSGAGKTSLIKVLTKNQNKFKVCISHTTRNPRAFEKDGEDYHFTSIKKFQIMIDKNQFIEYAQVFNNFYGTSKHEISNILKQGYNAILEIDWQGAMQVKKILNNNCISIFILPPNKDVLYKRLKTRSQNSHEDICTRIDYSDKEILQSKNYDFVIINDCFEKAIQDLKICFNIDKN